MLSPSSVPTGAASNSASYRSPLPDPLLRAVRVAGSVDAVGGRAVAEEELRLLHRRQEELRVARQGGVQRGGARLRGTDDEEVGERHCASCAILIKPVDLVRLTEI